MRRVIIFDGWASVPAFSGTNTWGNDSPQARPIFMIAEPPQKRFPAVGKVQVSLANMSDTVPELVSNKSIVSCDISPISSVRLNRNNLGTRCRRRLAEETGKGWQRLVKTDRD